MMKWMGRSKSSLYSFLFWYIKLMAHWTQHEFNIRLFPSVYLISKWFNGNENCLKLLCIWKVQTDTYTIRARNIETYLISTDYLLTQSDLFPFDWHQRSDWLWLRSFIVYALCHQDDASGRCWMSRSHLSFQ